MLVWLNQMSEITSQRRGQETYYVHGSGLMGVPQERMNEIPRLRTKAHAEDARRAMQLARSWRMS